MVKKKRQCVKGKSCGATCISKLRNCRVDAEDSLSTGLGKMSKKVEGRSDKSAPEPDSAQKFLDHVKDNSFEVPGRSFSGEDLAKMINAAAEDLDGEARANIEKLRQFVVKDGQVAFVSTPHSTLMKEHGGDTKKASEEVKKWSMSSKFISLLDKSVDIDKPAGYLAKAIADAEKAVAQQQAWIKTLKERIAYRESKGIDASLEKDSLKKANSQVRQLRKYLKEVPMSLAGRIMGEDGVAGWTLQFSRYVVLNETPMSFSYEKGRRVDAKSVQDNVAGIIQTRAKATAKTDPTSLTLSTHDFAFAYDRPNTPMSKLSNEKIMQTYVHEMGHQIHFRVGSTEPPANSVSLSRSAFNRGLTEYSTVNKFETFAEAFVAFTFNPKALRDADEPLYNWVRDSVDAALTKAGASASTP